MIPKSLTENILKLGKIEIPVAVLDNGMRVIAHNYINSAFGMKSKVRQSYEKYQLPMIISDKRLEPFISEEVRSSSTPLKYMNCSNRLSIAFNAVLLPLICDVFIKAASNLDLTPYQEIYVQEAGIIYKSLANIGIIGLIDEATGYQDVRNRRALQEILDQYLQPKLSKYAKTFGDDFYKESLRLYGYKWEDCKKPSFLGHFTNDFVYSRLAPGVLQRLTELNPKMDNGRRRATHVSHFTPDWGIHELRGHLKALLALMKISEDICDFRNKIDKTFPRQVNLKYLEYKNEGNKIYEIQKVD